MATKTSKAAPKADPKAARRQEPVRQSVTFEVVQRLAPTITKSDRMVATYGLEPVDYHAIREKIEEHLVCISNELKDDLNEKALEMFMQRLVGSFVSGAFGAGNFYRTKQSSARDLNTKLNNDDRDGDRDGVAGFESSAERAIIFAAKMGLQAFALTAAAEGAVDAFAHVTGNTWKPYEGNAPISRSVQNRSRQEMLDALAD